MEMLISVESSTDAAGIAYEFVEQSMRQSVRPNKATPNKVFKALSLGLTFSESMPDLAERQISFTHLAAPAAMAFLFLKLWTRRSTRLRPLADPCAPKVLHSVFSLE